MAGEEEEKSSYSSQLTRAKLTKSAVWIFGLGGAILFTLGSMVQYLPGAGGGASGGVEESGDMSVIDRQAEAAGYDIAISAPASRVDEAALDRIVGVAQRQVSRLDQEFLGDDPNLGIGALNRVAAGRAVRTSRGLRQAVEMVDEVASVTRSWPHYAARVATEEGSAQGSAVDGSGEAATASGSGVGTAEGDQAEADLPDPPYVQIDGETVKRLYEDVAIDLGPVGRGRIVDETIATIQDNGLRDFVLTLGDISYASGDLGGFPWPFTLAAPSGEQAPVRVFLSGRALVERLGAEGSDIARLYVIAGRADRANGYAEAALRLSADEAVALLEGAVATEAFVVTTAGEAQSTSGFGRFAAPQR